MNNIIHSLLALVLAVSVDAQSAQGNADIIDDLASIRLGMTVEALRRIRPAIRLSPASIDEDYDYAKASQDIPEKGRAIAGEGFSGEDWFTGSMYATKDGKLDMLGLHINPEANLAEVLARRNSLLRRLEPVLGVPSEIAVVSMKLPRIGPVDVPQVVWKRSDGFLILRLPTTRHAPYGHLTYGLNLVSLADSARFLGERKNLSKKQRDAFFKKVGIDFQNKKDVKQK